jgi:hypothetical protein
MLVTITFNNNYGAVPYTAASVKTPFTAIEEVLKALNYAFIKTQNIDESWSESKCDEITIAHHHFDGTPLRSSMVGDEFVVWSSNKDFKKYRCESLGWTEL